MPTVPKSLMTPPELDDPGLLSPGLKPDASSMLMAASLMNGMGKMGPGSGGGQTIAAPRRGKGAKGGGKTKMALR